MPLIIIRIETNGIGDLDQKTIITSELTNVLIAEEIITKYVQVTLFNYITCINMGSLRTVRCV